MYVVRTTTGEDIKLEFDKMSDVELRNLENSVATYIMKKKELDIQKSIKAIINFIEAEITNCPDLANRTACSTDDDYCAEFDWGELLCLIKDYARY